MTNPLALRIGLLAAALIATTAVARPGPPMAIDMTPDHWASPGRLAFSTRAGYPHGLMAVRGDGATLQGVDFRDGTIEFDLLEDADNQGIAGLWFHQRDADTAENVYLRIDAGCPGSVECVQYAPVSHGNVQWDAYPEYERSAPVHATGWNHLKLVVSGRRMNVYVNHEARPSLRVGSLEGDAPGGQLQLRGDATFANLVITPGATEALAPTPTPDPTAADGRYLRHWQLATAGHWTPGHDVAIGERPAASADWTPLAAERKGFVNLGRAHGTRAGAPDLAWLATIVTSDRPRRVHVALGWAREVWVFVNGQRVFADRNLYYPASGRKPPLGRLSIENGGFDLPLRAGANDIAIAIADDLHSPTGRHWGWGFEWRFEDVTGLTLPTTTR